MECVCRIDLPEAPRKAPDTETLPTAYESSPGSWNGSQVWQPPYCWENRHLPICWHYWFWIHSDCVFPTLLFVRKRARLTIRLLPELLEGKLKSSNWRRNHITSEICSLGPQGRSDSFRNETHSWSGDFFIMIRICNPFSSASSIPLAFINMLLLPSSFFLSKFTFLLLILLSNTQEVPLVLISCWVGLDNLL